MIIFIDRSRQNVIICQHISEKKEWRTYDERGELEMPLHVCGNGLYLVKNILSSNDYCWVSYGHFYGASVYAVRDMCAL